MTKTLFIAGTGKDVGKTAISLALMHLFSKKYKRIGYIKPISQRFLPVSDKKVGDDPLLIKQVFRLNDNISDMSPIVIDGDFTEKIIQGKIKSSFSKNIVKAFKNLEKACDLVIIEGAGHAGVGTVIDQSNADTAKLLNADVLLVGGGGIGRAIDKMMLDKSFFEARGSRVLGVIINKVFARKYEKVSPLLKQWFQKKRIPLFGILPYDSSLSRPDVLLIKKETRAEIISSKGSLDEKIERILIAAEGIDSFLKEFNSADRGTLLIVSIDRLDILFFLVSSYFKNSSRSRNLRAVLISGALDKASKAKEIFEGFGIPVLISSASVYDLATKIHDLKPKMLLEDIKNIRTIKNLSERFIAFDLLQASLDSKVEQQKISFITKIRDYFKSLFVKFGLLPKK